MTGDLDAECCEEESWLGDCRSYVSGSKPNTPPCSELWCDSVGSNSGLVPVTVLPEECEEGGTGRWPVDVAGGEASGEPKASSSGFAIRRPPSDWDRLMSAGMLALWRLYGERRR